MALPNERHPIDPRSFEEVEFIGAELFDFGRDMAILLRSKQKDIPILLTRHQAQKLFDEMWWAYYFRPTENP